jgi:hypothetical protein
MKLQEIIANNLSVRLRDLALDSVLAGDIQKRLIQLGCLDPPADGSFGTVSRFVLGEYAKQIGIEFDETVDSRLAQSLLDSSEATFIPLTLGTDFASRIIKFMQLRNHWIARLPDFLNIVYVEGANADGKPNADEFNKFNDRRIVIAIENGKPTIKLNVLATTEPGKHFTDNPMNKGGAARIAFGQYKAWSVGVHRRGKKSAHEALVQVDVLSVHRDLNKDGKRTGDKIDVGAGFFLNQHSAHNAPVDNIGLHGAGCLVGRSHDEHKEFMKLIKTDPRFKKASNGYKYISTVIAGDTLKETIV